ncbi:hypothetical protein L1987_57718 [Smallanthus sonchifolius]|uniref:Uncharacterized protein n=1 Tax=Smallanthus sonchifolius TaxID=185202 RepID=A0ACB9DDM1_9ASTR|nr:hypothetical protein L1987_57718 [Smallanthus sonchifolius]
MDCWPTVDTCNLLSHFLVNISKPTLTTIVPIEMIGHESSSSALGVRALLPQPLHLTRIIHLVELQQAQLHLLMLVLDLLRLRVGLLLALLRATAETEDEVES